jgi:hypothetical protein
LYTKEPRTTDKKILPVEAESIPEEFRVRPHADRAEQLSLLSTKELEELVRPSASRPPRGDEIPPPETAKVRKACRPEGGAVQDKLPGF